MKKVLIIVDCQNDFVISGGKLYVNQAETIIEPIKNKIETNEWDHIITTQDTHFIGQYIHSPEKDLFPIHCEINSHGWQIVDTINDSLNKSSTNVYRTYKTHYSIWDTMIPFSNEIDSFDKLLKTLDIRFDNSEIWITGVAGEYCVFEAWKGFRDRRFNYINIDLQCIKFIDIENSKMYKNYDSLCKMEKETIIRKED